MHGGGFFLGGVNGVDVMMMMMMVWERFLPPSLSLSLNFLYSFLSLSSHEQTRDFLMLWFLGCLVSRYISLSRWLSHLLSVFFSLSSIN